MLKIRKTYREALKRFNNNIDNITKQEKTYIVNKYLKLKHMIAVEILIEDKEEYTDESSGEDESSSVIVRVQVRLGVLVRVRVQVRGRVQVKV